MPIFDYEQLLTQLREEREQIEEAILTIERLVRGRGDSSRGKTSASTTKHTGHAGTASHAPAKKKRGLSAAGRKAISDAAKRRWAAKKAAQGGAAKSTGARAKKATKKRA